MKGRIFTFILSGMFTLCVLGINGQTLLATTHPSMENRGITCCDRMNVKSYIEESHSYPQPGRACIVDVYETKICSNCNTKWSDHVYLSSYNHTH